MAIGLAILAAVCIGSAVVTSKFGLRSLDARAGAAVSLLAATALQLVILPFSPVGQVVPEAVLTFAVVGFFYPALVTLLRFYSTDRLGPATTSAVLASATPLCALAAAGVWLNEALPNRTVVATCGVACGIALISVRSATSKVTWHWWWVLVPLCASMLSGLAQVGIKSGLALWPNPVAGALIGYIVSSAVIVVFDSVRKPKQPRPASALLWFGGTGVLNGIGVLALFGALNSAAVSLVAPIFAAYPLVTLVLSAAVLRDEAINARRVLGAVLTVASIAYLLSA